MKSGKGFLFPGSAVFRRRCGHDQSEPDNQVPSKHECLVFPESAPPDCSPNPAAILIFGIAALESRTQSAAILIFNIAAPECAVGTVSNAKNRNYSIPKE